MVCEKTPTVSVIIPTRNRSQLIRRAIQSVQDQTYHDFEIIIVDDASTDDTAEVVGEFEDQKIKYIRHEQTKGAPAARNTAVRISNGEYIAFIDDDDEWLPEKLQMQISAFRAAKPKVGIVYSAFWRIEGTKKTFFPSAKIRKKQGNLQKALLSGNFIGLPTAIVKRQCFEKAGFFDESFPRLQDWEFFIRCAQQYQFMYIDKPLLISYHTDKSISSDHTAFLKALELITDKYSDEFGKCKKSFLKHNLVMAKLFIQNRQVQKAKGCCSMIIRFYSFNVIKLIVDFFVLIVESVWGKILEFSVKRSIR
jgi:glycosyltransferase involved in cell wall biosynthesis